MADYHLLISAPPHREDADVAVLAAAFGKAPMDVRFRAKLAVPEIWLGHEDAARVDALAVDLSQAGFSVFAVPASNLLAVPDAFSADALVLHEQGILWDIAEAEVDLPAQAQVLLVYGRPEDQPGAPRRIRLKRRGPSLFGRSTAFMGAGMFGVAAYNLRHKHQANLERMRASRKQRAAQKKNATPESAFMDFYFLTDQGALRVSLIEGTIDYKECLGSLARLTAKENTQVIFEHFSALFSNGVVDRRLDKVSYRPSTIGGLVLPALLAHINPAWAELDPFDLASRLIYLTSAWKIFTVPELPSQQSETAQPPTDTSRIRRRQFE